MIERTPVPQMIAKQLQHMIQAGEFAAKDKLPSQRVLSIRMGVSRPSLREALTTLETLGLVRTYPGQGTFVVSPETQAPSDISHWRYSDEHSMQDVFEMRLLLECRLVRHAAQMATGGDIVAMTKVNDRMEQAWESGDLVTTVEADLALHRQIAEKSHNTLLLWTYNSISVFLTETQRQPIPFTAVERMLKSISGHRRIIAALHERDSDAAEAAMIEHIRNTAASVDIEV